MAFPVTPKTWVAGDVLTAAQLNAELRDALLAAFPLASGGVGAWTAYTPTNTNVTLGNGTQVARYTRIGRWITVNYDLLWGSTTAYAGSISIGIPVTAGASGKWIGSALYLDASVNDFPGVCRISAGGTQMTPVINTGGGVTGTTPFTWVSTDRLSISVVYEAAT